ncbi:hypothetical protein CIK97_04960 [Prevotella sp. P3-120]|nr:hypothetical protein CIK97_04960 [Prevotella sp. P3-120]OYP51187.1 hypothetical protein CIK93_06530 [Prevotella sp. P3-92]
MTRILLMSHGNQSSDLRRMFLGLPTARNLWRKSCLRYCFARNNLKFREAANKIFKKISTENALEFLASGKDLIGDRLRLEI